MKSNGLLLHRSVQIPGIENTIDKQTGELIETRKYVRKDLYQVHAGEKFILIKDNGSLFGLYTATGEPFEVDLKNHTSKCIAIQTTEGIVYSVDPSEYPIESEEP